MFKDNGLVFGCVSLHLTTVPVQGCPVICFVLTGSSPPAPSSPWVLNKTEVLCLGGDPGVFQALGGCGSFLRQQLQHGQQEGAELGGFLPRPLVLIQQDLQQTPRLQLGDVS